MVTIVAQSIVYNDLPVVRSRDKVSWIKCWRLDIQPSLEDTIRKNKSESDSCLLLYCYSCLSSPYSSLDPGSSTRDDG